jgi:hypothetical protein
MSQGRMLILPRCPVFLHIAADSRKRFILLAEPDFEEGRQFSVWLPRKVSSSDGCCISARWTGTSRSPFVTTLDYDVSINGSTSRSEVEFGDITPVLKRALAQGNDWVVSTGLQLSLPSGINLSYSTTDRTRTNEDVEISIMGTGGNGSGPFNDRVFERP